MESSGVRICGIDACQEPQRSKSRKDWRSWVDPVGTGGPVVNTCDWSCRTRLVTSDWFLMWWKKLQQEMGRVRKVLGDHLSRHQQKQTRKWSQLFFAA